jgi:hypothetical protein
MLRILGVPRLARGVPRLDPSCRFAELLRNFAQKLRGALFRFRRGIFFHKALHPPQFFVNALPELFEIVDALKPRDFLIDAFAELFESVHGIPLSIPRVPEARNLFRVL